MEASTAPATKAMPGKPSNMQTLSFDVNGMTCGGCTSSVQRVIGKLDGVSRAEVPLSPGIATEDVDPNRVTSAQVELVIAGLGYCAKVRSAANTERAQP